MRIFIAVLAASALSACSPPPAPTARDAGSAATQATAPSVVQVTDVARVAAPAANATVTSPLHVTGVAPANWYFENQFPVRLIDAQGNTVAEAPATPRVNWMENTEPKEFDTTLTFSATGSATLVLQEDNSGDRPIPREVRVPVTLTH
jgi:hypothetical protein